MEFAFVHATRVSRPDAFAWMTDYTEDDHRGTRWGDGAGRTIVSRSEHFDRAGDGVAGEGPA